MQEQRLYLSVAERIKGLIRDGSFPPGSRLPGERELAERFGVSRTTIREAEIALQALGYLHIRTGSGVYVLGESRNDGWPDITAFELTGARSLVESEAAALAARQIDDASLQRLDEFVARMSSSDPVDEEDSQRADREFHLTIAASSGNAVVRYVVETLWRIRTDTPSIREVHAAICAREDAGDRGSDHADILEALKRRDANAARNAMREHFSRLLESMIDVTEEQAMQELRQKASQSRERYLKSVRH